MIVLIHFSLFEQVITPVTKVGLIYVFITAIGPFFKINWVAALLKWNIEVGMNDFRTKLSCTTFFWNKAVSNISFSTDYASVLEHTQQRSGQKSALGPRSVPVWTSCRWMIAYACFAGSVVTLSLQQDMSMALVCMFPRVGPRSNTTAVDWVDIASRTTNSTTPKVKNNWLVYITQSHTEVYGSYTMVNMLSVQYKHVCMAFTVGFVTTH